MNRELAYYAAGAKARLTEDDAADAAFLDAHPGWSWADLQAAPFRVVAYMQKIDRERATNG